MDLGPPCGPYSPGPCPWTREPSRTRAHVSSRTPEPLADRAALDPPRGIREPSRTRAHVSPDRPPGTPATGRRFQRSRPGRSPSQAGTRSLPPINAPPKLGPNLPGSPLARCSPRHWRLLRPGPAHSPSGPLTLHTRVTALLKGTAARCQRCRTQKGREGFKRRGWLRPHSLDPPTASTRRKRHLSILRPRHLRNDASTHSVGAPPPARRVPAEHARLSLPGPARGARGLAHLGLCAGCASGSSALRQ